MTATNSEKETALRLQILLGKPVMSINSRVYQDILGTQYEVFGNFAYVTLASNRNIRIWDVSTLAETIRGMVEFLNYHYELDTKLKWSFESFERLTEIAQKFLARAAKPLHEYITEKREMEYYMAGFDYGFTHYRHSQGIKAGFVASEYCQDWAEYSGELAEICLSLPNLTPYVKDGLIHLQEEN